MAEGYGINLTDYPAGATFGDARALYDPYRKRFWLISTAITPKASPDYEEQAVKTDPIRQSAQRWKIVVAVSEADDAFGAWRLYWWDLYPDEDSDPDILSTQFYSHADYPLLGISENHLLVENKADKCKTGNPLPDSSKCGQDKGEKAVNLITVAPAQALANGTVAQGKATAWQFKDFRYP